MYSKKRLADSVARFIASDLMDGIEDNRLRFTLCLAKKALMTNPDVLDGFFRSPMIANVIREEDGEYDISAFSKILRTTLSECESYPITVPEIPVFAPRSVIRISAEDVDKLMSYLEPENAVIAQ